MSEEAKALLRRLKKEKKINKQIELIQKLQAYNNEEIVTHVLLVHLERKDHDAFRTEVLNALNPKDEFIIKPLSQILFNKDEPLTIRQKVVMLLGQNGSKKALSTLLTAAKKIKDPLLLDNIILGLTYFEDKKVEKPLLKALENEDLRLQVLTGLARNENLLLKSYPLIKAALNLSITKSFEKLHYEKILETLLAEFGYQTKEELLAAISDKSIMKKITAYNKKQTEIAATLKKIR